MKGDDSVSNFHKIDECNLINGEGIRTAIWFAGCPFHCKACFNPTTWNPNGGHKFTPKDMERVMYGISCGYCSGLTLLGGEPLTSYNVDDAMELAKRTKELGKTVWCYTGFTYEQVKDLEIMQYIDVLIDGRFEIDKFNPNLKWRGSANQRVIDVQSSLATDSLVLHADNNTVDKFYPDQAFDPCAGMSDEEIKEKYILNVCNEEI